MRAVFVVPSAKKIRIIKEASEPQKMESTDLTVRIFEVGVNGTNKHIIQVFNS